jgi:hypothetical protein
VPKRGAAHASRRTRRTTKVTAMNFDTDNRSYMQPMYADDSRGWESDNTLTRDDGYDWLAEVANRLHGSQD